MTWHPDMPEVYKDQIITGDCRELSKDIPDESVDLILTDPPFGIGFHYSSGYDDTPANYSDLIQWLSQTCQRVIRPGGMCFVFQAQSQLRLTWPFFPDDSRIFAACKTFVQMHPSRFVPHGYEPIIFWRKQGPATHILNGRDWHVANTSNTANRGIGEAGFHDCPRPIETVLYIVDHFCPPGGVIADFFAGSGTVAVAAKATGRHFIASEISPDVAERARRRVAQTQPPLTGLVVESQLALAEVPR